MLSIIYGGNNGSMQICVRFIECEKFILLYAIIVTVIIVWYIELFLSDFLGIEITTDNFLEILDNGVHLCNLAKIIQGKAEECVMDGSYTEVGTSN